MPLMLTRSPSAATMVPVVVSLAFGSLAAAVAALVFLPALWLPLHRAGAGVLVGDKTRRPGRQGAARRAVARALPVPAGQPAQPRTHGPGFREPRGDGAPGRSRWRSSAHARSAKSNRSRDRYDRPTASTNSFRSIRFLLTSTVQMVRSET